MGPKTQQNLMKLKFTNIAYEFREQSVQYKIPTGS